MVSDDPALNDVLVGAYSRFVLVGADGVRLHEEVLYAGGWVPEHGRFRRLENLPSWVVSCERALASGTPASSRCGGAPAGGRLADGLLAAVDWRTRTRRESLDRKLAQRQEAERARVVANFDQFAASLRAALAEDDEEDALFSRAEVERSAEELHSTAATGSPGGAPGRLDAERERELAAIDARYREPAAAPVPGSGGVRRTEAGGGPMSRLTVAARPPGRRCSSTASG